MTWTCTKCQNVNPTSECKCLRDGCDGTPWKEAGLSEEERAVLPRLQQWANEMRDIGVLNDGHVNFLMAHARHDLIAARAQLEAEVKTLRERAREMEERYEAASHESIIFRGDANRAANESEMFRRMHLQICEVAQERAEKIKALQAQLAQAQNLQSNEHVRVHGMGQESTRELFVAWLIAEGADDLVSKIQANGGWPPEVTENAQKPAGLPDSLPPAQTSQEPAASPPGEVSTEYIDKWCNFPPHSTSRICIVSDIRANVEREIERHQIEIARMEGRIDAQRKVNEALEMAARLLTGERDAALAEVKRLKGELAKANEGKANP